ncbi:hypothetical protein GF382_01460 [Candidatus Falkowbacteria bacterium]|nr:hypothetical protein [Candidatus Falkowbacteria bacterium]
MKKNLLIAAILIAVFMVSCLVYSFVEPYLIEEKHITISHPQIPRNFSGKKLVFITDTHYGRFFSRQRLDDLLQRVSEIPDVVQVLFGGDYADGGQEKVQEFFESVYKHLGGKAKYAGILGNHDYLYDVEKTRNMFGGSSLVNRSFVIAGENGSPNLVLAGIDDSDYGHPNLEKTLENTKEDDFTILLSHSPDISEELDEDSTVDLVLSGHTHGGQITFFGLWAPVTMSKYGQKYVSGETETPFGKTITSNGIGTVLLPMRFFARPQIIVLELEKIEQKVKIGGKEIKIEIADTPAKRKKGLSLRLKLCPDCGMLFVFEKEDRHTFWMKDTFIPLDMIFIDKNKRIVDIKKAEPCEKGKDCTLYQPSENCLYVLELNPGIVSQDMVGEIIEINIPEDIK